MLRKVLIIGPSGAGKTYVSAALRTQGINAVDSDLIEGLSDWYDGHGHKVKIPSGADKKFLDNHQFLWDRKALKEFLKGKQEIYLFGMSGNAFEMLKLFDAVYFLKAESDLLKKRLRHESRDNPMGKTDYQLQNALEYAQEISEIAHQLHIKMIDADQTPEEIFKQISVV